MERAHDDKNRSAEEGDRGVAEDGDAWRSENLQDQNSNMDAFYKVQKVHFFFFKPMQKDRKRIFAKRILKKFQHKIITNFRHDSSISNTRKKSWTKLPGN